MTEYSVIWQIDIDADNPAEAARKALAIQRNPSSIATVFHVRPYGRSTSVEVDLSDEPDRN